MEDTFLPSSSNPFVSPLLPFSANDACKHTRTHAYIHVFEQKLEMYAKKFTQTPAPYLSLTSSLLCVPPLHQRLTEQMNNKPYRWHPCMTDSQRIRLSMATSHDGYILAPLSDRNVPCNASLKKRSGRILLLSGPASGFQQGSSHVLLQGST